MRQGMSALRSGGTTVVVSGAARTWSTPPPRGTSSEGRVFVGRGRHICGSDGAPGRGGGPFPKRNALKPRALSRARGHGGGRGPEPCRRRTPPSSSGASCTPSRARSSRQALRGTNRLIGEGARVIADERSLSLRHLARLWCRENDGGSAGRGEAGPVLRRLSPPRRARTRSLRAVGGERPHRAQDPDGA